MNALIVVDMQNDFIDGTLGTGQAVEIVDKVRRRIDEYRSVNDIVIYTRDTHDEGYMSTQEGARLPIPHCIYGSHGWEITSALNPQNDMIINKPSFGSIELANYVKSLGCIDSVELVGLCTDICVISNAIILKSVLPQTRIAVNSACCAGVSPESHMNALNAMRVCHIDII